MNRAGCSLPDTGKYKAVDVELDDERLVRTYPLDEVLASDRFRLTGWLMDWLRS